MCGGVRCGGVEWFPIVCWVSDVECDPWSEMVWNMSWLLKEWSTVGSVTQISHPTNGKKSDTTGATGDGTMLAVGGMY